jgi:endonuclease-3
MDIIPRKAWNDFSLQLIYFGREICDAKKPLCRECPLLKICPSGKKSGSDGMVSP